MRRLLAIGALGLVTACLPTDVTLPMGSVAFRVGSNQQTRDGLEDDEVVDGWKLTFDRVVVSFKQMTIGKQGDDDACSYRGRGAKQNIVFDVREEVEQVFNGIVPSDCPDVGIVLGPPDDFTTLGKGIDVNDLKRLLVPTPAHAFIEATAKRVNPVSGVTETYRVDLRFDTARTTSRYGGCSGRRRGVIVLPNAREVVDVPFNAPMLFASQKGFRPPIHFRPFVLADSLVTPDHRVTMDELDQLPLKAVGVGFGTYNVEAGDPDDTFGDYVRHMFKDVWGFGPGKCNGNKPGATE